MLGRSMSTFINVWPGRWRETDRPVSNLVSTKWTVPAGSALAWFTQRFTHDRHAVGVRDTPRYVARYALLVRILALGLRQFAPLVRTQVRNHYCA